MSDSGDGNLSSFRKSIEIARSEALSKLESSIIDIDAEYAFMTLLSEGMFRISLEGYKETEHGTFPAKVELAAFYLYPKFGAPGSRDPSRIRDIIAAVEELQLLRGFESPTNIETTEEASGSLQYQVASWAEMVRGDSFAHQARRKIKATQCNFDQWFENQVGISPSQSLRVLDAFEQAANQNLSSHAIKIRDFEDRLRDLESQVATLGDEKVPNNLESDLSEVIHELLMAREAMPFIPAVSYEQIAEIVPSLTRSEWLALQALIGLTPDSRRELSQAREVRYRPLYFLSCNRLVFVEGTSVCDALFHAFDQSTRVNSPATSNFRDRKYVPHLSSWLEEAATRALKTVFPEENVYSNLTYPDPNRSSGEAELDIAVKWGPFIIFCEAKAKQYRVDSRHGNPGKLRSDLKANIEDAFLQATRASDYFQSREIAVFKERKTGRELVIKSSEIRRTYPLSVTLHHFAGLATQLGLLRSIKLFPDASYPWSVSYADLEIVAQFAATPDVFLHYIQRRIELQNSEVQMNGDELDLFGHYLDTRLDPRLYWEKLTDEGEKFDYISFTGGSERFDDWFFAQETGMIDRPNIHLNVPSPVLSILKNLRLFNDDGARWIAFSLLDFSYEALVKISHNLVQLKSRALSSNQLLRTTLRDRDVAITILVTNRDTSIDLRRQAFMRTTIEKYRLRVGASMLFAINVADTSKDIDSAFWLEGPWKFDSLMETMLEQSHSRPIPGQKIPAENEPCFCGSGRNFGNCCFDRLKQ